MPRTGKAAGRHAPGARRRRRRSSVGRRLGRPVEFHWCASAECAWNCLPEGRCDVVVGQPLGLRAGARRRLERPLRRRPVRAGGPARARRGSAPWPTSAGKRVGIVAGTVALAGEGPRGRPVQDARGAARRVRGRGAGRRVPRRRLRRLVPARASRGSACGSWPSTCPASAGTWPWPSAPRTRSSWSRSTGPWPSSPSRASSGRSTPSTGVPFRPPFTGDRPASRPSPDTWRRIRDRGELVVSMDPANLPYSSARGRSARASTWSWPGPWPSGSASSSGIEWLDIQRETRGGRAARAPVRPRPRRGRRRQRRRRRRGAGGQGPLLAALLRHGLRARPPQGRARGPVAGRAEGGEVAAPGHRGRLGRRLPPPPAGLPPPAVPQPARHAQGPRRRRHRLRLPLGQRRLDPARLARLRATSSSSRATCRRTTGTSRSPCAGATTSSSARSTRRSTP